MDPIKKLSGEQVLILGLTIIILIAAILFAVIVKDGSAEIFRVLKFSIPKENKNQPDSTPQRQILSKPDEITLPSQKGINTIKNKTNEKHFESSGTIQDENGNLINDVEIFVNGNLITKSIKGLYRLKTAINKNIYHCEILFKKEGYKLVRHAIIVEPNSSLVEERGLTITLTHE